MSEFEIGQATIAIKPVFPGFREAVQREVRAATQAALRGGTGATQLTGANEALTRSTRQTTGALKQQQKQVQQTRGAVLGLGSSTAKLDAALLGLRTAAGSAAVIGLGAGALAAIAFGKALRSMIGLTAQFETQLNVFQATTGATADEMRRVAEMAEQLGRDITLPAVSAGDAAQAMTELAKAGLSVQEAMRGARGVLQLATAANIDNAVATEFAASALNAFGLAGDQAVRVADVLANASNAAQGSISDMALALQQSAAVGRQVGLSLEQTTSFLTILAREGLRGSDAGTSLRVALLRLVNPTDKAAAQLERLGVSVRDAAGNLRPDFFTNLGIALQGMSRSQRDATLALIGGQDAVRALSILTRQSIDDILGINNALNEQGTAAEIAAARSKGLAGAGAALANTLETIGIQIGRNVSPALTDLVNQITAGISAFSQNAQVQDTLRQSTTLLGDAFSTLGTVLTTVAPLLSLIGGSLSTAATSIGVGPILAGVAAYRLLTSQLVRTKIAAAVLALAFRPAQLTLFNAQMVASAGIMASLRARATSLTASLRALALSPTGAAIAVGALATGLAFLITRESSLDRANRQLKESTDALAGALASARQSAEDLQNAISNVRTDRLAVQTAQLAVAQARQALEGSSAAQGSFERVQLENNLAVAENNLRLAVNRLADSQRVETEAKEGANQASANAARARREEAAAVAELNQVTGRRLGDPRQREEEQARRVQESITLFRERARVQQELNTQESRNLAARLRAIANLQQELGRLATKREIEIIFEDRNARAALLRLAREFPQVLGATGSESAEEFANRLDGTLRRAVSGQRILSAFHPSREAIIRFWAETGAASGQTLLDQIIAGTADLPGRIQAVLQQARGAASRALTRLGDEAVDLEIAGAGPRARLENLREQEEEQRRFVATLQRGTEKWREEREKLKDIVKDRRAVEEEIRQDIESATRDAESARKEADQAILDAVSLREGRLQTDLLQAQSTEGLGDDIRRQTILRNFYASRIRIVRNTVKDALTRNREIATLQADLVRANQAIEDLRRQQRERRRSQALRAIDDAAERAEETESLQDNIRIADRRVRFWRREVEILRDLVRERRASAAELRNAQDALDAAQDEADEARRSRRQQQREQTEERLRLRIEIAQSTGNINAEIRARNANIKRISDLIRQTRRGSLQRLRLIAELRREQKELRELKEETGKTANALKAAQFEFLQAQQGFAANLLGNLIPLGATSGLVGNVSQATAAVAAAATTGRAIPRGIALAEGTTLGGPLDTRDVSARLAGKDLGPTRIGQQSELMLLRQIVQLLAQIHRGGGHPEAKRSKLANRADADRGGIGGR